MNAKYIDLPLTGGCACGQIRYEISVAPIDTGYCHCGLCRLTTGAVMLAWATVPVQAFSYVVGQPSIYHSSAWGERRFCPHCGAQFEYRAQKDPKVVDVNVGTLDRPDLVPPTSHVWVEDEVPWLHIADDLPRYPTTGPEP
ncbi:GFA family protein [Microbaculum marinum]|uniref:GFA family protein n=1 Tax=Microbaculum marinum TaxID=1764581 RepID=A0AAW9RAB3_9HYPH